jgi:hypothetical protein
MFHRFRGNRDDRRCATAQGRRRWWWRSAGAARSPCSSRASSGARTSRGACAAGRAPDRCAPARAAASCRTSRCAADRRAAPRTAASCRAARSANAPRSAAALGASRRRPGSLGHGAARADAASFCASRAAAPDKRPQCRRARWRESCATEPARKLGAAAPAGRRFRRGTLRARRTQCRSTTKPRSATRSAESSEPHPSAHWTTKRCSATGCGSAESGWPRRSPLCSPRASGQQPTGLLRGRAAQPGFCQFG